MICLTLLSSIALQQHTNVQTYTQSVPKLARTPEQFVFKMLKAKHVFTANM